MTTTWTNGIPSPHGYDAYGPAPPSEWNPDDGALRLIAEADWADTYEFAMLAVWQDKATGALRGAVDSGCSCPTPFGDLTWEDMRPIASAADLEKLLEDGRDGTLYGVPSWESQDPKLADLKMKVGRALHGVVDGTAVEVTGDLPAAERPALNEGDGAA